VGWNCISGKAITLLHRRESLAAEVIEKCSGMKMITVCEGAEDNFFKNKFSDWKSKSDCSMESLSKQPQDLLSFRIESIYVIKSRLKEQDIARMEDEEFIKFFEKLKQIRVSHKYEDALSILQEQNRRLFQYQEQGIHIPKLSEKIGWIEFHEYTNLFVLKRNEEAWEVLQRILKNFPNFIPAQQLAWMFSSAGELAVLIHHEDAADDIVRFGRTCMEIRIECEFWEEACRGVWATCSFLEVVGRNDLNAEFAITLIEIAGNHKVKEHVILGYEFLLKNIDTNGPNVDEAINFIVQNYDDLLEFQLNDILERITSSPWFPKATEEDQKDNSI